MSDTPVVHKYPLDPTGTAPSNFVDNEEHILEVGQVRVIVPRAGHFFSKSATLINLDTGQPLIPTLDYKFLYHNPVAGKEFGQQVTAAIGILNESINGTIAVTYQAVGGKYESVNDAVIQALTTIQNDNRKVDFSTGVTGKPHTYPPSEHMHHRKDIYGMDEAVMAWNGVEDALNNWRHEGFDAIWTELDKRTRNDDNVQHITGKGIIEIDSYDGEVELTFPRSAEQDVRFAITIGVLSPQGMGTITMSGVERDFFGGGNGVGDVTYTSIGSIPTGLGAALFTRDGVVNHMVLGEPGVSWDDTQLSVQLFVVKTDTPNALTGEMKWRTGLSGTPPALIYPRPVGDVTEHLHIIGNVQGLRDELDARVLKSDQASEQDIIEGMTADKHVTLPVLKKAMEHQLRDDINLDNSNVGASSKAVKTLNDKIDSVDQSSMDYADTKLDGIVTSLSRPRSF